MSESQREDDEDAAWLLARAKGQPGPAIPPERAARYEKIEALLAELPATAGGSAPREGWQDRVFAAIAAKTSAGPDAQPASSSSAAPADGVIPLVPRLSRRRRRQVIASAIALAMAAAGAAIYLVARPPSGDHTVIAAAAIHVDVEPGSGAVRYRGTDARVNDTLNIRATAVGPGELRVYDDRGTEVARCSLQETGCSVERAGAKTMLRLTMSPRTLGTYQILLFTPPLGGPAATADDAMLSATRAQVTTIDEHVRVQ